MNFKEGSQEYEWYKLVCYYHANAELYDRLLTDERERCDRTSAYVGTTPEIHRMSNMNAIYLYRCILRMAQERGIHQNVINEYRLFNNLHYSAQGWIDEYNRIENQKSN